MPRPILGVTGGALTAERQRTQQRLRAALHAAGGVPVLLRPEEGLDALRRVHGVVLPGGGDIHPARYGAAVLGPLRRPDPEREEFEVAVAREAVASGVPILGVCLGLQVLVVALGGTLIQHLPDVAHALPHEGDGVTHEVRLDPASRLARWVGAAAVNTNSSHHQAPADLPPLLASAGRTADGVVEAAEGPGFTIGVGWHPETMQDDSSKRLFAALVEAAESFARAAPLR